MWFNIFCYFIVIVFDDLLGVPVWLLRGYDLVTHVCGVACRLRTRLLVCLT